jgi:hypothetical protein
VESPKSYAGTILVAVVALSIPDRGPLVGCRAVPNGHRGRVPNRAEMHVSMLRNVRGDCSTIELRRRRQQRPLLTGELDRRGGARQVKLVPVGWSQEGLCGSRGEEGELGSSRALSADSIHKDSSLVSQDGRQISHGGRHKGLQQ